MQITLFIAFSGPIDEDLELMTAYLLFFHAIIFQKCRLCSDFPSFSQNRRTNKCKNGETHLKERKNEQNAKKQKKEIDLIKRKKWLEK